MKHKLRIVSPDLIVEPLLALLDDTEAAPLVISGGSMTPFLVHGRDTVYLSKADRQLKRGDMVLYQRDNGRYVLHRVLQADGDVFTIIGDAQTQPEPDIRRDQIRAVVTAVLRKDKLLKKGNFWWDFFEKVWIYMVPIRPLIRNVYTTAKRLLGNKGAT